MKKMKKFFVAFFVSGVLCVSNAFALTINPSTGGDYSFLWDETNFVWAIRDNQTKVWSIDFILTLEVNDSTGHYMNLVQGWDIGEPGDVFDLKRNDEILDWDTVTTNSDGLFEAESRTVFFETGLYNFEPVMVENAVGFDYGLGNLNFSAMSQEPMDPVPEPGTILMFGIGLGGLAVVQRKKHNTAKKQA